MNTIDLFPETLLVSCDGGRIYTDSLRVAERFGKQHKNVLKAIKNLLDDLTEAEFGSSNLSRQTEFSRRNFTPSNYKDVRGKNPSP